jgi:hypothetical protein
MLINTSWNTRLLIIILPYIYYYEVVYICILFLNFYVKSYFNSLAFYCKLVYQKNVKFLDQNKFINFKQEQNKANFKNEVPIK